METETSPQILSLLKSRVKPSHIADELGIPLSDVMKVANNVSRHELGRPELRKHIVSVTRAGNAWPYTDARSIKLAQMQYDAGLIEMCQGRDAQYLIL